MSLIQTQRTVPAYSLCCTLCGVGTSSAHLSIAEAVREAQANGAFVCEIGRLRRSFCKTCLPEMQAALAGIAVSP